MKKVIKTLDATPPKEIYRSIINDYDLKLGICELIDNAIDLWTKAGANTSLKIIVLLDDKQQKITVHDNAGGIGEDDMLLLVSPGRTGNIGDDQTIGIFGVGAKRAVVALAENVKMTSRKGNDKTCQVSFDQTWLEEDEWSLYLLEVDNIEANSTQIELLGLRNSLTKESIDLIKLHISSTYAFFLQNKDLQIIINNVPSLPILYDENWAYPPDYSPKTYKTSLLFDNKVVEVEMTSGLLAEGASEGGESGVYFYCNNRLITKSNKDYEMGYRAGKAGSPTHPSSALARTIVQLNGHPSLMPWNSSKSQVNYQSKVFEAIRESLIDLVAYFVKLSVRLMGDYKENIYKYKEGNIEVKQISSTDEIHKIYDIPLPRVRRSYGEKIIEKNKTRAKSKPYIIGLYESIIAVDSLSKGSLKQKNRMSLILLDSDIEIALKDYLVFVAKIGLDKFKKIKENRKLIIDEVKINNKKITDDEWDLIDYYYKMRCNLIHQMTTADVKDDDIISYREVTESLLHKLFGIEF